MRDERQRQSIFDRIKQGKVSMLRSGLFDPLPDRLKRLICEMTRPEPGARITASGLVRELSDCKHIWKNQVRRKFLTPLKKKAKPFACSVSRSSKIKQLIRGCLDSLNQLPKKRCLGVLCAGSSKQQSSKQCITSSSNKLKCQKASHSNLKSKKLGAFEVIKP